MPPKTQEKNLNRKWTEGLKRRKQPPQMYIYARQKRWYERQQENSLQRSIFATPLAKKFLVNIVR